MEVLKTLKRPELDEALDKGSLLCRAICEILGKPKEYVEETAQLLVQKAQELPEAQLLEVEVMEAIPQGKEGTVFSTFAEMQILFKNTKALMSFCFDFMPSSLELIEPEKIVMTNDIFASWLNELQGRLHQVDMVAKEKHLLAQIHDQNISTIIRYNLLSHLKQGSLSRSELQQLVGIDAQGFERYLSTLIQRGEIITEGANGTQLRLSPSVRFTDESKKQG